MIMRKRTFLMMSIIICILSMTVTLAKADTTVYVDPSEIELDANEAPIGYRFNVTCWVSDVTNLFGYQVTLYYNSTVINMTDGWIPTWNTSFVFKGQAGIPLGPSMTYFDSWGQGLIGYSLVMPPPGQTPFNGTGLLGIYEFEVAAHPPTGGNLTSELIISWVPEGAPGEFDTKLKNSTGATITILATDGNYVIVPEFLGMLLLPMFSMLALVVAVLGKKLQRKPEIDHRNSNVPS
jgi:hypothetical protein